MKDFPCGSAGKESSCNSGDLGLIPGLGRSPGERKGYPLQYSGLENSMDHIIHGVAMSWTRLTDFHFTSLIRMTEQARYIHAALLPPSIPRGTTADRSLWSIWVHQLLRRHPTKVKRRRSYRISGRAYLGYYTHTYTYIHTSLSPALLAEGSQCSMIILRRITRKSLQSLWTMNLFFFPNPLKQNNSRWPWVLLWILKTEAHGTLPRYPKRESVSVHITGENINLQPKERKTETEVKEWPLVTFIEVLSREIFQRDWLRVISSVLESSTMHPLNKTASLFCLLMPDVDIPTVYFHQPYKGTPAELQSACPWFYAPWQ